MRHGDTGPVDGQRLQDLLLYEGRVWSRGLSRVAGVDEVGRGSLAGPVVAAAVILPPGTHVPGAADSKTLRPERREQLCAAILASAACVALGAASVHEIERLNILRATTLAMRRALARLPLSPEHVVVDGLPVAGLSWPHEAVVDGDALVHTVSCASIVAKVCRDRLMRRLGERYPAYAWGRNAGYGTPEHLEALRVDGLTPHHRRTFCGLQLELGL